MRVTDVKYTRRFNLSDYEHEEFTLTIALDEGETASQAIHNAKDCVNSLRTPRNLQQETINGRKIYT